MFPVHTRREDSENTVCYLTFSILLWKWIAHTNEETSSHVAWSSTVLFATLSHGNIPHFTSSNFSAIARLCSLGILGLSKISMRVLLPFPFTFQGRFCIAVLQRFEIIDLRRTRDPLSTARLVWSDIHFAWPINSNTAFLSACLNIHFRDWRIHFRFRVQ